MFDIVELSVPLVAEVTGGTPWNREHMAERYGLFTIIVLGESLLGSANAIIEALDGGRAHWSADRCVDYDHRDQHSYLLDLLLSAAHGAAVELVDTVVRPVGLIFASAGAFSAGIEAHVDYVTGSSELSHVAVSLAVTVPVTVFILAIWAVAYPGTRELCGP